MRGQRLSQNPSPAKPLHCGDKEFKCYRRVTGITEITEIPTEITEITIEITEITMEITEITIKGWGRGRYDRLGWIRIG